jgi:membrane protein implicated in regulation of membrane protease activity
MTPSRTCFSLKGTIIWLSIACWRIQRSLLMAMRSYFLLAAFFSLVSVALLGRWGEGWVRKTSDRQILRQA